MPDLNNCAVTHRAERARLLRAFRATGQCPAWLVTPDELDALTDDEAASAGPSVDEIDWTGIGDERDAAPQVSRDNGRSYVRCSDLSEDQATHFAACHPYDADVSTSAEGAGTMVAWLTRYATAYHRKYGCWPVI